MSLRLLSISGHPSLRFLLSVIAAIGISALAHAAPVLDSPEQRRQVEQIALPLMQAENLPGLAIGLIHGPQTALFCFGVASRDPETPVDENTLFEIGSVSKVFNATLACYAQEQGRLSFADSPARLLPALAETPLGRATLLQLGTYTAGDLPLQLPAEIDTETKMLRYFRELRPSRAPGTCRSYSNPSIGLLGYLTAQALQTSYADAVEQQLLPALGLSHTYVRVPAAALSHYAWGHTPTSNRVRVTPGIFDAEAYGIKTTVKDLAQFVRLNLDAATLPPVWQRAIAGTHLPYFQIGPMAQGLGWEQYAFPTPLETLLDGNSSRIILEVQDVVPITPPADPSPAKLFNKTGSTNGFGAYVLFVPQQQIGIILLANRNFPIPARVRASHALLLGLLPADGLIHPIR